MHLRKLVTILGLMGSGAVALISCAGSEDSEGGGTGGGGATSGDGSAMGGKAGTGGLGTGGSGASSGSSSGGSSGVGGYDAALPDANFDVEFTYDSPVEDGSFEACAKTIVTPEPTILDMYVMLDRSGSMLELTAAGNSKWDAIKQALTGFLQDPKSAGIGCGMNYFPILKPGVPSSCTSNTQCGAAGPCLLKTCLKNGVQKTVIPCATNADCGGGPSAQCVDLGTCSKDPSYYCIALPGYSCGTLGNCNKLSSSVCANPTSCAVTDYATPAVPIAPLPGVANSIINSINKQNPQPEWMTPTAPALQGAINYSKVYAGANPSHTVVTVLATDGMPTVCPPTDIPSIAAIASAGVNQAPSIKTFVIGVFAAGDKNAQTNLNTIASAGGTSTAYIVDPTSGSVTTQFIAALQAIQTGTVGCEFQMPTTSQGIIDPAKVELRLTSATGMTTIQRVTSASACSGDGWYYDNNTAPTKLILCPATCTKVKADTSTTVDVSLGCLGS